MDTLKNGNIQENRKNTKLVIALRKIKDIKNRENIKMVIALRQFKYSRNLQTSKWRRVGENVNIQQFTCQNEQKHQHDRRSQKKNNINTKRTDPQKSQPFSNLKCRTIKKADGLRKIKHSRSAKRCKKFENSRRS